MNATRRALASATLAGILAVSAIGCSSSKGGATGSFCTKLRSFQNDKALSGTDSATLAKSQAALHDLVSSAPSSIKSDAETLQTAFDNFVTASNSKDPAKLAAAAKAMATPAMMKSEAKLTEYSTKTCGIKSTS